MHSIVTTFRGAEIKVEVANFCTAMDTLIDQDGSTQAGSNSTCDDHNNHSRPQYVLHTNDVNTL